MVSSSRIGFLTLSGLSASNLVFARERWLERDDRSIFLYPRRFRQEQPAVLQKISAACPDQVCGTLASQAVTPLLAAQPACSQQDMADAIIDASRQFNGNTQTNMIALAIEYRLAEKNTPPDFTRSPPSLRNSVFCQKAPKNPELTGLVQAQDPANDPNLFFDPALKATVKKGSQANTYPFGGAAVPGNLTNTITPTMTAKADTADTHTVPCATAITVTVLVTISGSATTVNPSPTITNPSSPTPTVNIGNFGKCSIPQIEFGTGFDGRKETSFQPVDKNSYSHGSAQNIGVITQFICDTLTNSCGADQTAKNTCATAKTAASAALTKTGAQADSFNAVFGITTNFVDVPEVDNQGNIVPGTGNSNGAASTTTADTVASTQSTASSPSTTSGGNGGIGNFSKCSTPQIEFGAGFDGRRETSFQPVDKASFNHGSAQNIAIITQFICDRVNSGCGADNTAKATCTKAQAAAASAVCGTGAQADAFNAVFGISTSFASVTPVDDHGAAVEAGNGGRSSTMSSTSSVAPEPTQTGSGGNLHTFSGTLGGVLPPVLMPPASNTFEVGSNSRND